MEIVNASQLDWTSDDVFHLRTFLETQTGKRLIPKLAEQAPPLLGGGDTNNIITRAGELRGFQAAVQAFLALTEITPAPQRTVDNFPTLDEDVAQQT